MAAPIEGTLRRPDAVLRFDQRGEGPDMLLLHAGGERRSVWRSVMDRLAGHCRCTAYDQRGHGDSGGRRSDPVTAFGEDAAAMIASLHRPVVVGASLGGFAALLALAEVERDVAGLVLVDVVPDPDPARTHAFLAPLGLAETPLVADILGRAEQFRAIAAGLSLPILAVRAGARGPMVDVDAERFRKLAPQARVVTVPEAGHLIAREKPIELAELLAAFLASPEVRERHGSATITG
jgi:pimeloyl-ACP methyl ester carboxylesterase